MEIRCPFCKDFEETPNYDLHDHVLDMHDEEVVDCGSCGCLHPKDFWGDCRDDNNRF
ncbi:hypothetical protein LCGC14_1664330 [marine sediment metagenome]|uniref:Uncharacterized protein n=1 Tax=marine sediment metagenome TaxID=412755 RepID=A0A0F9HT76_9ZZZZ